MGRWVLRGAITVAISAGVLGIALLAMWSVARYQSRSFEQLSDQLSRLKVGQSTFHDLDYFRRAYKAQITEDEPCTAAACTVHVVLANFLVNLDIRKHSDTRWMDFRVCRRLGVRPAGAIGVISVRDDKVQDVVFHTLYETPRWNWLWAGWRATQLMPFQRCVHQIFLERHPTYLLYQGRTGSGAPPGPFVEAWILPDATKSQYDLCRRIRYSCMTSISDCSTDPDFRGAEAMMPDLRQAFHEDDEIMRDRRDEYAKALDVCPSLVAHAPH